MFFIKAGSIIAWLLVVGGGIRVVMGFIIASSDNYVAATKRYLGSGTTGEAIDKGFMWLVVGVVIGLLVQIAKNREAK